jgi:Ca2+-binding EF-hand superfamily protein
MEFTEGHQNEIAPTQKAAHNEECSICYEPLNAYPTVNLCNNDGTHSCIHVYHERCIEMLRVKLCPYCRTEFVSTAVVPKLEYDTKEWFDYLDEDKDGALLYEEIIDGLKAQMLLNWRSVEVEMDKHWSRWDKDGNGSISYEEFIDPDSGLLSFMKSNYPVKPREDPPNLATNKVGWFEYWDEDNTNTLEKEEVLRALIKTFHLYDYNTSHVRDMVEAIWPIFDVDGSGSIDKEEFVSTDNLADTIIAQLTPDATR